jgi:hypothetical protein
MPVYQAVADTVGSRLGMNTELVVETSYDNCAKDVNDVCFVCSLPYVEFERQGIAPAVPIAAPVLEGERYGGRPVYFLTSLSAAIALSSALLTCADIHGATTNPCHILATELPATICCSSVK